MKAVEEYNFNCSWSQLTTLKCVPRKIGDVFNCSCNELTTLKGAPKEVGGEFDCHSNNLITLEGVPRKVGCIFDCSYNKQLEDISDLPTMVEKIHIQKCPNIKVFTKEITNKKGTLTLCTDEYAVKKRIRSWLYYEVVEEEMYSITVKTKTDNEVFMDAL